MLILGKFRGKGLSVLALELQQVVMGFKGGVLDLDDADTHVGAVVGNTLTVGENIGQDHAYADGAFTVLETENMAIANLHSQIIDNLFQRLDVRCLLVIALVESGGGQLHDFRQGSKQGGKFIFGSLGEGQTLLVKLLSAFCQIGGVVAKLEPIEKPDRRSGLEKLLNYCSQFGIGKINNSVGFSYFYILITIKSI